MKRLVLMRNLIIATGLLAGATACKSEDARDVEKAAERVQAKSTDLKQEQKELRKELKESADEVLDEAGDVARRSAEVDKAIADFERKRQTRIDNIDGQLTVLATMPSLISAMAQGASLNATERVKLDEKLQILQVRIEEAKHLAAQLPTVSAANWTAKDDEITKALRRIDDLRDDAVDIIHDATRPGT